MPVVVDENYHEVFDILKCFRNTFKKIHGVIFPSGPISLLIILLISLWFSTIFYISLLLDSDLVFRLTLQKKKSLVS